MILRQYLHTDPVIAASYLFGCGGHAAGAVVDPVGEPERYLEAAAAVGLRLRYVIDTHVHADHLSAGRELAEAAGAEYILHASAEGRVSVPRGGGWRRPPARQRGRPGAPRARSHARASGARGDRSDARSRALVRPHRAYAHGGRHGPHRARLECGGRAPARSSGAPNGCGSYPTTWRCCPARSPGRFAAEG